MKITFVIILFVLVAAIIVQVILSQTFLAEVARQEGVVLNGPVPEARDSEDLPVLVRQFAERGLAVGGGLARAVRITQEAELRRGDAWQASRARQHIAVAEPGFVWLAEAPGWPMPSARVIDRFVRGEGLLEVRLLGAFPVARFLGPDADVGEAMRYLAELPWVPDAILANRAITWTEVDARAVEAALFVASRRVSVRFIFDEGGDIVEMNATGRPDVAGGETVLRDWRGVFSDYGEIGGRRIPRRGEVGYVHDGAYAPYFRGRVTSYEVLR